MSGNTGGFTPATFRETLEGPGTRQTGDQDYPQGDSLISKIPLGRDSRRDVTLPPAPWQKEQT